jgi:hypothetical protein
VLDSLYVFSAVAGGAVFVVRTILMLLGIGDDHSFGGDHDLGADHAGGQVQVSIQGRLGVYEAQASGGSELATGRAVRVVAVRASQLVVEALPAA